MELLIAVVAFALVARILVATASRAALILFGLLVLLHLVSRSNPELATALTQPLLALFVVAVGYRLMLKGLLG